jgi:cobalt-zinc-cadmium efflux system outer membrane protein
LGLLFRAVAYHRRQRRGDASENEEMTEEQLKRTTLALCVLAVTGCAAGLDGVAPPESGPLGREFSSVRPANVVNVARESATQVSPDGAITLREALALSLHNNPRLAAFSWEVRAREAAVLQAGLLPNPEITFESENIGGSGQLSGTDGAENTVVLSQLIELGGKRSKRRRLAQLQETIAGWDYETVRMDTFTDVALAYLQVLASQDKHRLAQQLVTAGDDALRIVSKEVSAGGASMVEKHRAELALASSRIQLTHKQRELESARSRLAAMWGSTSASFTEASGDLESDITPPPPASLVFSQVETNPDIARWAAELSARRARLALEQSKSVPDVTLGGGSRWLNETNDNAFVFALSVPLPLFDRNQGNASEARHRLAKATEEQRAAELDIKTSLANAYRSLESTHKTVVALQSQVLPKATEAYEEATSAYRRGVYQYSDVLDTQQMLFELRAEYLSSASDYHAAVARVERLVGRSLDDLRVE